MRRLRLLLSLAGLLGLGLALAPGVAAGDPCYHGYTVPPVTTDATSTVTLDPCAFVPTVTRVAPGSEVTFRNTSEFEHLLTGANARWGDRDKLIAAGASVAVRFDQPGIYAYSCALHRGMSGAVVVGDGGTGGDAAAAASTTPSAGDRGQGTLMGVGLAGLAGLALLGWGVAFVQRRRVAMSDAART